MLYKFIRKHRRSINKSKKYFSIGTIGAGVALAIEHGIDTGAGALIVAGIALLVCAKEY